MTRCLGLCGLTVLLCVLGCLPGAFVVPPPEREQARIVVHDSVAHVYGTLQDGLSDLGILVIPKKVDQDQRLIGVTKAGKTYRLHLRPGKNLRSESTVVSIEWGGGPDPQFCQTVIKLLKDLKEQE